MLPGYPLTTAIVVAFFLFLFLFYCFYSCLGITGLSSFVLAYLIAYIILSIAYPIYNITGEEQELALVLYTFLSFLFFFVILIYVVYMASTDCRRNWCGQSYFRICRGGVCPAPLNSAET
jgi:hypothetical protein